MGGDTLMGYTIEDLQYLIKMTENSIKTDNRILEDYKKALQLLFESEGYEGDSH